MGRQNVAFSSGCVTCAFLKRKPWNIGRSKSQLRLKNKKEIVFYDFCRKKKKLKYLLCEFLTIGLIKRSYFGGLRVKPSPTKQTFVTILFQAFFCLFPVLMTFSTSVSPWARTFGRGTSHLPYRTHDILDCQKHWSGFHPSVQPFQNGCTYKKSVRCYLPPSLSSFVWSYWKGL